MTLFLTIYVTSDHQPQFSEKNEEREGGSKGERQREIRSKEGKETRMKKRGKSLRFHPQKA